MLQAFCWSLLYCFLSRITLCNLVICKRTRRGDFSALGKSFEVWWKLSNPVRGQRVKTVLLQSCIITVFVVIDNTVHLNFSAHLWKCKHEETFVWAVWFMLLLPMHICQEWQFKRCRIACEFRVVAMFTMKSSHHELLDIERSNPLILPLVSGIGARYWVCSPSSNLKNCV